MSTRGFYPDVFPGTRIDFSNRLVVPSPVEFDRATSATYVDKDGVVKIAYPSEPRFSYDPETGESLGLLLEESRTNQIVNSQVFTSGYNQSGLNSITQSTSITTPQGLTDGVGVITESVGGTVHQVYTASTTQVTGYLTYSVFVKPNGRNYCVLCTSSFTHDLINGTTLGSASGEFVSATTVPFPNGWVRCTLTRNHSNTFDQFNLKLATGLNSTSYSGDGTSGVYIWGAQREAGTFPTSYIPTSGSTETRAADEASITGTNFTSFFNASASTLYTDYTINDGNSFFTRFPATINNGTSNNFYLRPQHRPNAAFARVESIHTVTTGIKDIDHSKLKRNKLAAFVVEGSEIGGALNGSLEKIGGADPEGVSYAQTQLSIGQIPFTSPYQLHISRLTYWPKRLPDIELQQLTK